MKRNLTVSPQNNQKQNRPIFFCIMRKIILISFILSFILASDALAHQPRIVSGEEIIQISSPEISQAFYGELKGKPAHFEINSDKPFKFYVGLLVPDLPNIKKDFSARVFSEREEGKEMLLLNGKSYNWTYFYEEFAGDAYYKGPEARADLEKGKYIIEVFNENNLGKYVLAVGEKEEFPVNETFNTLKVLPKLKKDFFEKSPLSAFFNKIGLYIFLPLIILLVILIFLVLLIKYKRKNKKKVVI